MQRPPFISGGLFYRKGLLYISLCISLSLTFLSGLL